MAFGTNTPLDDLVTQQHYSDRLRPASGSNQGIDTSDAWDAVYGELIAFEDPVDRLLDLDHLEGFEPGESSVFRRVLIPSTAKCVCVLSWVYTVRENGICRCKIESGFWQE